MRSEIQRKKFENTLLKMLIVNIAALVVLICYC